MAEAEEGRSPTWALSGSPPPSPERGWNAPGSLDGHFHFLPVASATYLWVTGQHIWFSTQFGFSFFFPTFYFSCFSENLAISFVSKRASSNHLDHILDPPKTVKSRTKSFWIPPLTGKRTYTMLVENSTPLWKLECPLLVQNSNNTGMKLTSRKGQKAGLKHH